MTAKPTIEASVADYSDRLRTLMTQAALPSYRALSRASGVPRSALDQLRRGGVAQLRVETVQRLGLALGLSVTDLVALFSGGAIEATPDRQLQALRQECDRLQTQLTTQADATRQQVQREAIAQLEPWLVQWPTVVHAVQQRPDLPAQKLIPLVRPVEALVKGWGVTAIAAVGATVPFDPQIHQAQGAAPAPGDPVTVSHVGYRQGDRLLYRARVVPATCAPPHPPAPRA